MPPNTPTSLRTLSKRARLRRATRIFLDFGGRVFLAWSVLGLLLVASDVLIGLPVSWWVIAAALLALAMIASVAFALTRAGTPAQALSELDDRLKLDDRLASALSFSTRRDTDDPFVRLAIDEGEAASRTADARRGIPLAFTNAWVFWPALCVAWVAMGLYMPRYDLLGESAAQQVALQKEAARTSAAETLRETKSALEESLPDEPSGMADEASDDSLETLEKLAEELESGAVDPDEAREKAAGVLDESARQLEQRAEQAEAAERARNEIMERLAEQSSQSDTGAPQSARELREALAQGDMARAAKALEELEKQSRELPPDQREARQQALKEIADDLESAGEETRQETQRDRAEEREELREWGLDEQDAQDLQELGDEEDIREALEDKGFDEQAARRNAQRIAENERDRRARENAAEETERLSEDLRDASEDLGEDPPETTQPPDDPRAPEGEAPQPESERPEGEDKPGDAPKDDRAAEPNENAPQQPEEERDRSQENEQRREQPGNQSQQPEKRPDEQPQGTPEEQQKEGEQRRQQPTKDPSRPNEGNEAQRSAQKKAEEEGAPTSQPDTAPQDQKGQQGQPRGREQTGADEGVKPGEAPQTGEDGQDRGGAAREGDGLRRLKEQLQRMNEQSEQPEQYRKRAEDARQRAKKMLEQMSPEERERLERWLAEKQRDRATGEPFDQAPIDARKPDDSQRIAGEVTNPDWEADRATGRVSERELVDELREAAQSNDRALEERTVPAKYRNVEEYFKQTIQRVEEAKKAEPVDTAKDADGNK